MMDFGLRHIRCFIAVAEELHFRRAAERLGVAQPALSRTIQHLETILGFALFIRTNRQVTITPAGAAFLNGVRNVANSLDFAAETALLVHQGRVGSLRIGYTDFAIAGALPNILQSFRQKECGITLQPQHGVTTDQLSKLNAGEIDIGFVTGPLNIAGFQQALIQKDDFACFVYDNHPLANRKSIQLSELANEDFVQGPHHDWEHFNAYLLPLCRAAGFIPNIVQEAFNSAGILGLVASGMGVTILTASTHGAMPGGLVQLPLESIDEQITTVALWKDDNIAGSKQRFVEFLRNHLSEKAS